MALKARKLRYYWECKRRRHDRVGSAQCPARLITEIAANGVHRPIKTGTHSHEADPSKVQVENLIGFLKEGGRKNKGAKPSKVISDAGALVSSATQARLSKNAQRQIIKRVRTTFAPEPKKLEDINIPEELRTTIGGDKFYHGYVETERGDRAYLFTSVKELRRMKSARYWTADATFDVPATFRQLFSVHCSVAPCHNSTIPAFFALMTAKSEKCYRRVLEELVTIAAEHSIQLQPKRIFTDFEKSMQNAFDSVFPKAQRTGCFFHWTQALRRKMETLKIAAKVSKSPRLNDFFCMVKALAFVPHKDIPTVFDKLEESLPKIMIPWWEYVADTYVHGRVIGNHRSQPLFDPSVWSIYQNVLDSVPRNTNSHESWHARLIRLDAKKLKIYELIRELRQEQKSSEGKVHEILSARKGDRSTSSVIHDGQLLKVVVKYRGYDDKLDYLEAIAAYLH
ncbi:conserved hypothetical protein [Culex quinquefasciatus]|uniref:MULE transposase domain-containing protein n=1 Tax=Culex quinquefasciatus TaxID=7176 RepID=B0WFS3_CULQU|nr:conserved hypothetical protein [Culex quinquefasciatus]|eukprot:XP_001847557.1 conserved hypothetical protein [Culex quinquefasciatus]